MSIFLTLVLARDCEERAAFNLFPKIETSVVPVRSEWFRAGKGEDIPVLSDVAEIIPHNWPNDFPSSVHIAVLDEPFSVCHDGNGS